jgi:hypothetical protein
LPPADLAVTVRSPKSMFGRADDGTEHWHNSTDVHWDTSTSIGVTCRSCGWRYEGLDYIEKLKREG